MRFTESTNQEILLYTLTFTVIFLFSGLAPILLGGCSTSGSLNSGPAVLDLLNQWNGDYPVSGIGRLPAGQRESSVGYIGDRETFMQVWRVFMPKAPLPVVDFNKNIVIFSRNVQFYNRTSIFKITLQNSTADIFTIETMSSLPIEDKVSMAMALIPRQGIQVIRAGVENIRVIPHE